jgi:hypothetical protein
VFQRVNEDQRRDVNYPSVSKGKYFNPRSKKVIMGGENTCCSRVVGLGSLVFIRGSLYTWFIVPQCETGRECLGLANFSPSFYFGLG